jgi:hypothetical protein
MPALSVERLSPFKSAGFSTEKGRGETRRPLGDCCVVIIRYVTITVYRSQFICLPVRSFERQDHSNEVEKAWNIRLNGVSYSMPTEGRIRVKARKRRASSGYKEGPTLTFFTRKLRLRWGRGWGTRKGDSSGRSTAPGFLGAGKSGCATIGGWPVLRSAAPRAGHRLPENLPARDLPAVCQ